MKLPDFCPLRFDNEEGGKPQILRPTTQGKYRCGYCGVKGHTRKICPIEEVNKDRDF